MGTARRRYSMTGNVEDNLYLINREIRVEVYQLSKETLLQLDRR